MWYVIQTMAGQEEAIRDKIRRNVPEQLYLDCRVIYAVRKRRYQGAWHEEKSLMFPGYVFIITQAPENMEDIFLALKKVQGMTKLLGYGEDIVPVTANEEAILERLCGESGDVPMSYGIQEGDSVRIIRGSLAGMESLIKKIDRHKRKAVLEIEMLGITRQVEVGLEIVEKR